MAHTLRPQPRWRRCAGAAVVLALAVPCIARADAVWLGTNPKNPIKAADVKILRVEGSNLVFAGPSGDPVARPMSMIQQIAVDDEPAFSAAEQAYRENNAAAAESGYASALQTSTKDWVQMRSAVRLTTLASQTHAFDAAVSAFIFLLQKDPSLAVRPSMADADASSLASSSTQLKTALATPNLSPAATAGLLRLSIDVDRARGEKSAAEAALERLVGLGVATPAETAAAALARARAALTSGDFAKAADEIEQHRSIFTDPATSVAALDIVARAHDGLAKGSTDPAVLEDVAIDYMRVVALGHDLPNQPAVPEALLRVGQIEESLKQPQLAANVYRQVSKEFPSAPAAAAAKQNLQRLGAP